MHPITRAKVARLGSVLETLGLQTRNYYADRLTGTLDLVRDRGWRVHVDALGAVSLFHISEGTHNARKLYKLAQVDMAKRQWSKLAAEVVAAQVQRGFPTLGQRSNVLLFPQVVPAPSPAAPYALGVVDRPPLLMPSRPWTDDWTTGTYLGEVIPEILVNSQGIVLFSDVQGRTKQNQTGQVVPHEKVTPRRLAKNPRAKPRIHRLRPGWRHGDINAIRLVAETFHGPPPVSEAAARLRRSKLWRSASNVRWHYKPTDEEILEVIRIWGQGLNPAEVQRETARLWPEARHVEYTIIRNIISGAQHRRPKKELRHRQGNQFGYHAVNNDKPLFDIRRAEALLQRERQGLDHPTMSGLRKRLEAQGKLPARE